MKRRPVVLLIGLLLVLFVAGCGAPPDQTVTKFLEALTNADVQEMAKHVHEEGGTTLDSELTWESDKDREMAKVLFGRISYKIGNRSVNKDTATVSVAITCVDVPRVLADTFSKVLPIAIASAFGGEAEEQTQALLEQTLENAIRDPNAPMTTVETTFNLKKIDGRWLIVFDEKSAGEFLNAITGNLGKALGELK